MTYSLSDLVGQPLAWVCPLNARLRYNLIAPDNSVIATFPDGTSDWRVKAKALVPSGTLFPDGTFFLYQIEERSGFLGNHHDVYVFISTVEYFGVIDGYPLVVYKRDWPLHIGELMFPDEHAYRWCNASFWGRKKLWKDSPSRTNAYVQFSQDSLFETKIGVVIYPQAAELPELSLLLVLGLYNILIEHYDREPGSFADLFKISGR